MDLGELMGAALQLVSLQMRKLEMQIEEAGGYNSDESKEACALARTLTSLIAEARKLEDDTAKRVASMGYDEQVELIMYFIEQLPPEHQARLFAAAPLLQVEGDYQQ